jgi:hypothetical protein
MTGKQMYAVVLTPDAVGSLGTMFNELIRSNREQHYIYATEIDSSGNYFRMQVEMPSFNPETMEEEATSFELQMHHHHIKFVFNASDMKKRGFI